MAAAIALGALALLFIATTKLSFTGRLEGLFLLKGRSGRPLELKDDLYLGDGGRVIFGVDLGSLSMRAFRRAREHNPGEAYIYYEWDMDDGSGFVRSYLGNGREILTCFSRFVGDDGRPVHGLFVGGGLPANIREDDLAVMSETGMAFFDGKRWVHLWCTANEGLTSGTTLRNVPPADWKLLGSRVLNASDRSLALTSSHEAVVDGVPLRVDRFAYFRAGETFFILNIRITNEGDRPVSFFYCYGDEPWVGEYGTSRGNVGWVNDQVINFAQAVDSNKYSFAGFFDFGNEIIGEGHGFTKTATFIEWFGKNRPLVYFSNGPGQFAEDDGKLDTPLAGDERFIGLQWGPQTLAPGEKVRFPMAIGMAGHDTATGLLTKPEINLSYIPQ